MSSRGTSRRTALLWALALVLACPVALFVGFRLYAGLAGGGGYYATPSRSMEPTLGQHGSFFALPATDGAVPARGAIVVFRKPGDPGAEWVMRVVALPGERIAMANGRPVIDGVQVPFEAAGEFALPPGAGCQNEARRDAAGLCLVDVYRETLPGGRSHLVLDLGAAPADDMPETTVPGGHVFVLGDNRDNALDSRFPQTGPVALTDITGLVWRHALARDPEGGPDLGSIMRRVR